MDKDNLIKTIKNYVNSITIDNDNSLIIQECFAKAIEFIINAPDHQLKEEKPKDYTTLQICNNCSHYIDGKCILNNQEVNSSTACNLYDEQSQSPKLTAEEIIKSHLNCTCDEAYKSRKMTDPNCVLCEYGSEIELMMQEFKAQGIDLENIKDKVNCLIGYLERWNKDSESFHPPYPPSPPSELSEVIEEAKEWLQEFKAQGIDWEKIENKFMIWVEDNQSTYSSNDVFNWFKNNLK